MSLESSKALKELGSSIRAMSRTSSSDTHIASSKAAVKGLKSLLQSSSWEETDLLSIIPAVTVASLLIDIVECTEQIADSVNVLASLMHFDDTVVDTTDKSPIKESQSQPCECDEPGPKTESSQSHVVILVHEESALELTDRGNSISDHQRNIV